VTAGDAFAGAPTLTVHGCDTVAHHAAHELRQRIGDLGATLHGFGIAPRTLLAIALPDPVDQIVAFLGAIAADVVPCLLPPPGQSGEDESWTGRALVLSGPDLGSATVDGRARVLDDALYVQRTSGTGRRAAGIVISRGVASASVRSTARRVAGDGAVVTVGWLPLHHDYGLMSQLLLPMALDGPTVLIPAPEWLRDPALLLDVVTEVGGTHTYMPAFGFRRCVDKIDPDATYDLSSWRFVNCAGEPVPPDLLPAFETLCRPWGLRPGAVTMAYGMAEVVAAATTGPIGGGYRIDTVVESALTADGLAVPAPRGRRFVGCGPTTDCLECAVVGPDGAPRPERTVGEIALRGATLGRLLTEAGTEPLPTTADGWFRSGDLGYLADGEVHVVDRIKDLLLVGGVNLHPSRVEDTAVQAAPGVRRAAAFMAVLDRTTGIEQPVLLLERPRTPVDEARALRAVRRALLAIGFSARRVRFVDRGTIAVTTSGKVRRQVTRDGYVARLADAPEGAAPGTGWLAVVGDVTGIERPDEHDTLQDLGIDSLALVELLTALETALDVTIDDRSLTSRSTVADLGRLVGETPDGTWPPPVAGPEPVARARRPHARLRAQIRRGPVIGPVHLPLRLGTPVHRRAAALRLRRDGSARAVRAVVDLAESIGACDADEIARISVIANSWEPWRWRASVAELRRAAARDRAGGRGRRPVLQVLSPSHLADAVAAGRGVVLVAPHVRVAPILPALPHLAGRPVLALDARGTTTVDRTHQLRAAHRVLRAGGTVVILADEFVGNGGITIDIAGKERPLRPGFARLALATESAVVPVFPSFDAGGRVTIDVRAPMGAATEHDLLVDFGALLRAFWHEHTGSLAWNIVRRHLNHPA